MITKMVIDAINKNEDKGNGFVVPIGVSARHIHLTQADVETLFGKGLCHRSSHTAECTCYENIFHMSVCLHNIVSAPKARTDICNV